jgi:hypothetical protein
MKGIGEPNPKNNGAGPTGLLSNGPALTKD